VILAAVIFGVAGYVVGSSGKEEASQQAVAPTAVAPVAATSRPLTVTPPLPSPLAPTTVAATTVPGPIATANPGPPVPMPSPGALAPNATPRPATTALPGQTIYTVVPNDSLSAIADRQGVKAADLDAWILEVRRLNGLPDNTIQPGQRLTLPPVP
jgi:LysM repeat protein